MPKSKLSKLPQYIFDVSEQLDVMYESFKDDAQFSKKWTRLSYNVAALKEMGEKISGEHKEQQEIRLAYQNPAFETYLAKKLRGLEHEEIMHFMVENDVGNLEIFIKKREEEIEKLMLEAEALRDHNKWLQEFLEGKSHQGTVLDKVLLKQQQELREMLEQKLENINKEREKLRLEIAALERRKQELEKSIAEHRQAAAEHRRLAEAHRQAAEQHRQAAEAYRQKARDIIHAGFEQMKMADWGKIPLAWSPAAIAELQHKAKQLRLTLHRIIKNLLIRLGNRC